MDEGARLWTREPDYGRHEACKLKAVASSLRLCCRYRPKKTCVESVSGRRFVTTQTLTPLHACFHSGWSLISAGCRKNATIMKS